MRVMNCLSREKIKAMQKIAKPVIAINEAFEITDEKKLLKKGNKS